MASYPNSVVAFTTTNQGDLSQPSDINDVRREIEAIEGGLLNGTAPLVSSHASVQGLNVTGNSTLGSSITIGTLPYVLPSSGGSTGQVLTIVSTSGSTMTVEWRAVAASGPVVKAAATVTVSGGVTIGNVSGFASTGTYNATGDVTLTLSPTLASSNYWVQATPVTAASQKNVGIKARSSSTIEIIGFNDATGSLTDVSFDIVVFM